MTKKNKQLIGLGIGVMIILLIAGIVIRIDQPATSQVGTSVINESTQDETKSLVVNKVKQVLSIPDTKMWLEEINQLEEKEVENETIGEADGDATEYFEVGGTWCYTLENHSKNDIAYRIYDKEDREVLTQHNLLKIGETFTSEWISTSPKKVQPYSIKMYVIDGSELKMNLKVTERTQVMNKPYKFDMSELLDTYLIGCALYFDFESANLLEDDNIIKCI